MIAPRRFIDPELVGILDARLPKEISDEILAYCVWMPWKRSNMYDRVFYLNSKGMGDRREVYFGRLMKIGKWCEVCGELSETTFYSNVDYEMKGYVSPLIGAALCHPHYGNCTKRWSSKREYVSSLHGIIGPRSARLWKTWHNEGGEIEMKIIEY